jgi:alpha-L-fucosidase
MKKSTTLFLLAILLFSCNTENKNPVEKPLVYEPSVKSINTHQCPEWFEDAKFGMFIDYGLFSVAGHGESWGNDEAKYPDWYLFEMYNEWQEYHKKTWGDDFQRDDFIPLFTAENYNPQELVQVAVDAGMKYVVPFSKHHDGFCLWPSSYTKRNTMDMGPGKDLIKPLVEECMKNDLKFGFYFSLEEWEYPVIKDGKKMTRLWRGHAWRHKNPIDFIPYTDEDMKGKMSGKVPVNDFHKDYIVPQAKEFIDLYDPDIVWFDGEWLTPINEIGSLEITSYFLNNAEGRKEVAVNDRLGKAVRFRIGDFFTSEYHSLKTEQPKFIKKWEECRGISRSFGFNFEDTNENVISTKEFIDMFVRIVSENGNLLLIVNLDGKGAMPDYIKDRLVDIGKWLKINGEAIYETKPWLVSHEGENLRFTQSKDGKIVYAICNDFSKINLEMESVFLNGNSSVHILGTDKKLNWNQDLDSKKLTVEIPEDIKNEIPSKNAYILKIEI